MTPSGSSLPSASQVSWRPRMSTGLDYPRGMASPGEQDVPKGPLAVRWLRLELPEIRAGAAASAHVELENAGTTTWRSLGEAGVRASYHWLDERGNPIVWDGLRTPLPAVEPGERAVVRALVRAPTPPGRYRLSFDLVDEHRLWFAESGSETLDLEREVAPRIGRRLAALGGDAQALAA